MQGKTFPKSREAICHKLDSLGSLSFKGLKQQWRSLYSSEPPLRVSRELLIRAVHTASRNKPSEDSNHPLADCWSVLPATRALEDH